MMVGATATVSTLVTVVGHPNTPTSAGNGGFSLKNEMFRDITYSEFNREQNIFFPHEEMDE